MIEAMIAASIVGILCLGMGSVAVNMSKTQEQANLYSVLNSISVNMQKTITDANAWKNTVSDPANMALGFACITSHTSCTAGAYPAAPGSELSTYSKFDNLSDGATPTGIYYQDNSSLGYTFAGMTCNSFVSDLSAPGDDLCPISYRLRYVFYCPENAPSCIEPTVVVFAFLQYHPGSHGVSFIVNTLRYSVTVTRSADAINRNDQVRVEDSTTGGANPLTQGICGPGLTFRKFLWPPVSLTISDPAGNVSKVTGGTIINMNPGGYVCNAIASGYAVDGFNIGFLVNNIEVATSTNAQAQGTTSPYGMQQARISNISINQSTPFTIQLRQTCQSAGTVVGQAFGLPLNFSSIPDVFAGVYCTRIN